MASAFAQQYWLHLLGLKPPASEVPALLSFLCPPAMGEQYEEVRYYAGAIIGEVQDHIDCIVYQMGLDVGDDDVRVRRMGSREYGCASKTSDLDLYLTIPNNLAGQARTIRSLLAKALLNSTQAKDGRDDGPSDQPSNFTLKWTSTRCDLDCSLLVAEAKVVRDATSATKCLREFFDNDAIVLETVRATLGRLREAGVLNSHGRKSSVSQSLKTAPAALLCVALLKAKDFDRKATMDSRCAWLLKALSLFDATAFSVCYDFKGFGSFCDIRRDALFGEYPLRIVRSGRNSANRLTYPQWARFQYICHQLSGSLGVPPFPSFSRPHGVMSRPLLSNSPFHVRLHLPVNWDWNGRGEEDFAVLSFWPGVGTGTLLVASGNSNDVSTAIGKYRIRGYKWVVVVTWCKDHNSNPSWFPDIFKEVARFMCEPCDERIDLLGLSRGVQAIMHCFDSQYGCVPAVVANAATIVLAGGCNWQRGDPHLPVRVVQGLRFVGMSWFRPPLSAVVVSDMDTTVRKRGDVSKKSNKSGHRVDYQDFSQQVGPYTLDHGMYVLGFASHMDVLNLGMEILQDSKLLQVIPNPPFDFICGAVEKQLMRCQEGAEAGGTPQLMPGSWAPQKGAEAGGTPGLMPGSLVPPSEVVPKGTGNRPYVFADGLPSGGELPQHREKHLQDMFENALLSSFVVWVFGGTGVGKSRRSPLAVMMALVNLGIEPKGVLHVNPKKLSAYSLLGMYQDPNNEVVVQQMASIFNGDMWHFPWQKEFVVLSTPASTYHRLRKASSWQDLSLIVFDEIQVTDGLVYLLIVYVIGLISRRDPRASGVRVLLMTATPRGSAYNTLLAVLGRMRVNPGTVTLSASESYKQYKRTPLWDVVDKPDDWADLTQHEKVIVALILMTEWHWYKAPTQQSASILIFAAGETEVHRMVNAIRFSDKLKAKKWEYDVLGLWGSAPSSVEREVKDRLDTHKFSSSMNPFFLVLTPGVGEDGWTPKANGMINCRQHMTINRLGFLVKENSDEVSDVQRRGRVGRVADSLTLDLGNPSEPSSTWTMPYPEQLKVCLAARELGVDDEIPGLTDADRAEAEIDLVMGDTVFKICVVWVPAGYLSTFLL